MTVSTTASYGDRSWTGVETTFAPGFRAQSAAHVEADFTDALGVVTALTRGVHFSAAIDGGGNVSCAPIALPPAPGTIRFYRLTPALQGTDFANLESYAPGIHTLLHDAAALRDQELARDIAEIAGEAINRGWSPVFAIVADGARLVLQIASWTGGDGTAPASGAYVGASGFVGTAAAAVDIRGAAGAGTGDVVGPSGGTQAMQFAFYSSTTGKAIREGLTLSPAQLTASVSDYAPGSLATAFLVRLDANAAWSITGLTGGVALRPLLLVNTSASIITLTNEDAASTAANRFAFGGNVQLAQHEAVLIAWDPTSSRWRRFGGALPDASVKARHIGAGEVTQVKLAAGAVSADKLDGTVAATVNLFPWATFH
jgi:hypothetical protein